MAEDKREAILTQLREVASTLVPAANVYRNHGGDIPENKRPAIVVLDGDETTDDSAYGRGRPANGGVVVGMTPHVFAYVSGRAEDVGAAMSELRVKLIKAVLQDAGLLALCVNGDIRYLGMESGFAAGRSMEGEAAFAFQFNYHLRPAKL